MPVLTRSSLEASPLADLHELASDLELDGYRRLRKADLVDRILEVHGAGDDDEAPAEEKPPRARRSRRTRDADTERPAREPREEAQGAGNPRNPGGGHRRGRRRAARQRLGLRPRQPARHLR
jgi:transcription termination factor Rho